MKRIFSLAVALVLLLSFSAASLAAQSRTLYVSASGVNLRSGPSAGTRVLDVLEVNKALTYLGKSGSWYKVSVGGKTGYVSARYISDKPLATHAKASFNLNIRGGPGVKYAVLGTLKKGDSALILGILGSWCKIRLGTLEGYVYKPYTSPASAPASTPAPPAAPVYFPFFDEERDRTAKDDSPVYDDTQRLGTFINRNNEKTDDEILQSGKLTNYLLYGYHVLNYGYVDAKNIKLYAPIFDEAKLLATATDHYKNESPDTQSQSYFLLSSSASTLNTKLDLSASANYKSVFFSGSIKAEYGLTTSVAENTRFIKYIQAHRTKRVSYTVPVQTLQACLDDSFMRDVNTYALTNPNELFNIYGTHAIMSYYLGGRSELNFIYRHKSEYSEEDIEVSARAAYMGFSGAAKGSYEARAQQVLSSSNTEFFTKGGINLTGTDPEDISPKYEAWIDSIEQYPVLCDIPAFDSAMLPIWKLIADPVKSKSVEDAFETAALAADVNLSQYSSKPLYITHIGVYSAATKQDALNMIPSGYTKVLLNPATNSVEVLEANNRAAGNWIYIAYKLSPDRANALTDIAVISGGIDATLDGYTRVPVDLNEGAGGNYVYLCYTRAKSADGNYLKEIRGVYARSYSLPEDWEWPKYNADLNDGVRKSGATYIQLAVRKGGIR